MRCRSSHRKRKSARSAFTLFEVLIALALSTLLIAGVYVSFDMYWTLRTAGEESVERSQIARAVLRQMELDIRAVTYNTAADTASADSDISGEGTENDDGLTEIESVQTEEAFGGGGTGLVGDSTSLVLGVNLPQQHTKYAAVSEAFGMVTSDQRSVTYLLVGNGMGALQQAIADRSPPTADDDNSEVRGLARLEGDRLTINQADEQADINTLADQAQLLAREIKVLQFEYHDGFEWLAAWDSSLYGGLPGAVRITIGFAPETGNSAAANEEMGKVYQLIVKVPAADSAPGSANTNSSTEDDSF